MSTPSTDPHDDSTRTPSASQAPGGGPSSSSAYWRPGDEESRAAHSTEAAEPGASRHGNFINYYRFHPAEERASRLPIELCRVRGGGEGEESRKYVALDVGCNAGDLTLELHKFLTTHLPDREISILGIDLDPILIERAREKNDRPSSVSFECLDFFSSARESFLSSYLSERQVSRFHASFCFSITMWIHLNHGDDGLERFLADVCAVSEAVLVEPQPWRCYRQAARRLRRADLGEFTRLAGLRYRGDGLQSAIEALLRDRCGFREVAVTEENDWRRRLLLYERRRADVAAVE